MTTSHTQLDDRSLWKSAATGSGPPETPCPSLMAWSQWTQGHAEPADQLQLESHLAQCDECYQLIAPFMLQQAGDQSTNPIGRITRWAAAIAAAVVVSVLAWHAASLSVSPAKMSANTMIAEASFGSLDPSDRADSYSVIFAFDTVEVTQ